MTDESRPGKGGPVNIVERPEDITLDPLHAAAVEAACELDRARVAAGERSYKRLAVPHEFCQPGEPCVEWPLVLVTAVVPGIRVRLPIAATVVAA